MIILNSEKHTSNKKPPLGKTRICLEEAGGAQRTGRDYCGAARVQPPHTDTFTFPGLIPRANISSNEHLAKWHLIGVSRRKLIPSSLPPDCCFLWIPDTLTRRDRWICNQKMGLHVTHGDMRGSPGQAAWLYASTWGSASSIRLNVGWMVQTQVPNSVITVFPTAWLLSPATPALLFLIMSEQIGSHSPTHSHRWQRQTRGQRRYSGNRKTGCSPMFQVSWCVA